MNSNGFEFLPTAVIYNLAIYRFCFGTVELARCRFNSIISDV